MRGSILAVAIMVVIAVASFTVVTASSLHSTVRTGLEAKAKTATDFFANYITKTYAEYYDSAYKYAEAFEDGDKIELEFVGTDNRIIVSTYGLAAGTKTVTQDIADAIKTGEIKSWTGRHPSTHEHILSVSAPMIYSDGQVIGVMRYMTSLRNVDRQTFFRSLIAVAIGVAMLFVVVLMNLLFIVLITLLSAAIGLLIGILKPIFDWPNEQVPVKSGTATTVSIFGGWFVGLACGAALYFTRSFPFDFFPVLLVILAVGTLLAEKWIFTKGTVRFESM